MRKNVLSSWHVISSSYPQSNRWLRVLQDRCLTPLNVEVPSYVVVERPDFVMAFELTEADAVKMVRQLRHGAGGEGIGDASSLAVSLLAFRRMTTSDGAARGLNNAL